MKVNTLSFVVTFCLLGITAFSQKVGHVHTIRLIDSLNEAKQASQLLKQYDASLTKTGEEMFNKYKEKLKKYQADVKSGNLTPLRQKQMEEELQIDQDAINKYRQSAHTSLEKRRQELIQPILDKINKALEEIGKEENYLFIFDNAAGILYFNDSDDVSAKVFKKLGYQ